MAGAIDEHGSAGRPARLPVGGRRRLAGLAAVVLGLHVVAIALAVSGLLASGRGAGHAAFTVSLAVTAYVLGVRHAFDADHLGAIDNVTRRLTGAGRRPLTTGLWFALGHSTVVVALVLAIALGVHGLGAAVTDDGSGLHAVTSVIGPVVSGVTLLTVGLLNLALLLAARRRAGTSRAGGLMTAVWGRATRAVDRPWKMYPLGALFGLGFDTATEIALLLLPVGSAHAHLPTAAVLALPLLFAAGMALFDTLDGVLMGRAYRWAMAAPERGPRYDLGITGASIAIALGVGVLQLASTVGPAVDGERLGYGVVALLTAVWVGAALTARRRPRARPGS